MARWGRCFPVGCWSPMDNTWVSSGIRSMPQNCVPHSALHSGLPQTCSALDNSCNFRNATMALICGHTDLVGSVPKGRWRLSWTNRRYRRNVGWLVRTKLKTPMKWMEASRFTSSKESAPYTMCWESDVHCAVYWWVNIVPRLTYKADGKRCLLLHVPAAAPSSSAQEKTTTPGGI